MTARPPKAIVRDIEQTGRHAIAVGADVASERDVVRPVRDGRQGTRTSDRARQQCRILEKQTRLDGIDAARLNRIFATNVTGAFLCSREAVRRMSTRYGGEGGGIVNVSSRASQLGAPGEYVDYAASKGAVDALTVGLSTEVAEEGIRVNAVRPGFIYTEMHASGGEPNRVDRVKDFAPMKRVARPVEVASAILWLLSDEASYTNRRLLSRSPAGD